MKTVGKRAKMRQSEHLSQACLLATSLGELPSALSNIIEFCPLSSAVCFSTHLLKGKAGSKAGGRGGNRCMFHKAVRKRQAVVRKQRCRDFCCLCESTDIISEQKKKRSVKWFLHRHQQCSQRARLLRLRHWWIRAIAPPLRHAPFNISVHPGVSWRACGCNNTPIDLRQKG